MATLTEIRSAVSAFERLQNQYRSFGAGDTEPDGIFQQLLIRAFCGEAVTVPDDAAGWDLYSSVAGANKVAVKLKDATEKVVQLMRQSPISQYKQIEKYLKSYCWRVSW